jgi:hypothetical protein
MACDSRADGEYIMTVEKVFRLPQGGFVGGAGNSCDCVAAIRWMQAGEVGDPPSSEKEDSFYLLILRPDGTIWRAENRFPAFKVLDDFAATGSGSNLAMAAMEMGASAADSVRVAAKYDSGTGGRVREYSLERKPRRRRK